MLLQVTTIFLLATLGSTYTQSCIRSEVAAALRDLNNRSPIAAISAGIGRTTDDELAAEITRNVSAEIQSMLVPILEEIRSLRSPCYPYQDNSEHKIIEGVRWTRFWWYIPHNGWPSGATDVLGVPYGACSGTDSYCFGRLPGALEERDSELLAIDSAGSIYRWHFDPANPTAHAAWNAFYHHRQQRIVNSRPWDPHVVNGPTPNVAQDSFMYRPQNGVWSVMLDDDNCDCYTTLSMGHRMCGSGTGSNGPSNRLGVDLLYDTHCQTPDPKHGLTLYFRDDDDCAANPCRADQVCRDGVGTYTCLG